MAAAAILSFIFLSNILSGIEEPESNVFYTIIPN